jgi:enhancing lycopene biosynthesis protein 2
MVDADQSAIGTDLARARSNSGRSLGMVCTTPVMLGLAIYAAVAAFSSAA